MTIAATLKRLATLAADHFGRKPGDADIGTATHLRDDLRGDDFDIIDFGIVIEAEFDVDLPEDWHLGAPTIGDVVGLIDRLMAAKVAA